MIWIIEESPNPGVWHVLQSRGFYKTERRAVDAAKELQRWHYSLPPTNKNYARHFRAVPYGPISKESAR